MKRPETTLFQKNSPWSVPFKIPPGAYRSKFSERTVQNYPWSVPFKIFLERTVQKIYLMQTYTFVLKSIRFSFDRLLGPFRLKMGL
jgi:hypothetical protein